LENFSVCNIGAFVACAVDVGVTVLSDGFSAYKSLKGYNYQPKKMAAHIIMPRIHLVFANFKRWALGTYHGVQKPHLRRYLDEFVFRWNQRHYMKSSFDTLLDIAAHLPHAGYHCIFSQFQAKILKKEPRMREFVTLKLDGKTLTAAKEKAAADNRSLENYLEHVVTKEIKAVETPQITVFAPENVRDSKPVRFPDDTDEEFNRRNAILDAFLDATGH
jgi:hypothetical protein